MLSLYCDSSAFTKRYAQEVGTEIVDRIFSERGKLSIVTSFLTILEFQAYLARRQKAKVIPADKAAKIKDAFAQDLDQTFVLPLATPSIRHASRLIDSHALKAPDAIQLSTCMAAQDFLPGRQWTFVCSDQDLLDAAKKEGVDILDPAEKNALRKLEALLAK